MIFPPETLEEETAPVLVSCVRTVNLVSEDNLSPVAKRTLFHF